MKASDELRSQTPEHQCSARPSLALLLPEAAQAQDDSEFPQLCLLAAHHDQGCIRNGLIQPPGVLESASRLAIRMVSRLPWQTPPPARMRVPGHHPCRAVAGNVTSRASGSAAGVATPPTWEDLPEFAEGQQRMVQRWSDA